MFMNFTSEETIMKSHFQMEPWRGKFLTNMPCVNIASCSDMKHRLVTSVCTGFRLFGQRFCPQISPHKQKNLLPKQFNT